MSTEIPLLVPAAFLEESIDFTNILRICIQFEILPQSSNENFDGTTSL